MPRHVVTRHELDNVVNGLRSAYKIIGQWPVSMLVPKRVRKYVAAAIEVLEALRPLVR